MTVGILTQIVAKNPPSILLAIGGIGWLVGIAGAGTLLFMGFLLQIFWLAKNFI